MHSVMALATVTLINPSMTHGSLVSTDEHGHLDLSHVESGRNVGMNLPATYYIITIVLYGGFITVIVAVFMVQGPKED